MNHDQRQRRTAVAIVAACLLLLASCVVCVALGVGKGDARGAMTPSLSSGERSFVGGVRALDDRLVASDATAVTKGRQTCRDMRQVMRHRITMDRAVEATAGRWTEPRQKMTVSRGMARTIVDIALTWLCPDVLRSGRIPTRGVA